MQDAIGVNRLRRSTKRHGDRRCRGGQQQPTVDRPDRVEARAKRADLERRTALSQPVGEPEPIRRVDELRARRALGVGGRPGASETRARRSRRPLPSRADSSGLPTPRRSRRVPRGSRSGPPDLHRAPSRRRDRATARRTPSADRPVAASRRPRPLATRNRRRDASLRDDRRLDERAAGRRAAMRPRCSAPAADRSPAAVRRTVARRDRANLDALGRPPCHLAKRRKPDPASVALDGVGPAPTNGAFGIDPHRDRDRGAESSRPRPARTTPSGPASA